MAQARPLGLSSKNDRRSAEVPGKEATWNGLDAARHRLKFDACYCSVLDECWITDLTPTARPKRVSQCEPVNDGYAG